AVRRGACSRNRGLLPGTARQERRGRRRFTSAGGAAVIPVVISGRVILRLSRPIVAGGLARRVTQASDEYRRGPPSYGCQRTTKGLEMSNEPQIRARAAQHDAAPPAPAPVAALPAPVDDAFPALFGGLAGQGIAPPGPPLIRYLIIDMAGDLQIELGVPVAAPVTASGRVRPGVL